MKISTKIKLAGILMIPMMALGLSAFSPVSQSAGALGAPGNISDGASSAQGDQQAGKLFGDGGIFTVIVNVLLYLIGAISVVMLIYGGIRYTISAGDSAAVTNAKNTIMYAVIGIIIAILAYAIVNFVLTSLT